MSALLAALLCLLIAPARAATKLAPDQLRLLQLNRTPDLLIIDVRDPNAFVQSHIQGAQNIPAAIVTRKDLPHSSRIVVYCGEASCPLSSSAADALTHAGYPNVFLLDGGLAGWQEKSYPVQTKSSGKSAAPRAHVRLRDVKTKLAAGQALVLDIRPESEFKAGHLPKALNIPLEKLDASLSALPKGTQFVVCDRKAARARQAVKTLKAAGFDAVELPGGVAGWTRRNGTLEVR